MTRSREETLAYQRGYNRAGSNAWRRMQRLFEIMKGYRARLTDISTERLCKNCDRWTRGCEQCKWGTCRADFEWGIEPRMWIDVPHRPPSERPVGAAITTQEGFGCVSWMPKRATLIADKRGGNND